MTKRILAAIVAVVVAMSPTLSVAANLVQNGNFSSYTTGPNGVGNLTNYTTVTDWTTPATNVNGYANNNFLFQNGVNSSYYPYNGQYYSLWDQNTAGNGFTGTSPTGDNYLVMDGDPLYGAPVSQTIIGLTPGQTYTLNFTWAAGQLNFATGATTEQFEVSLGSQTDYTSIYPNPSMGFSGWMGASMTFTATGSSEPLTFTALGTPVNLGLPPMLLLTDVSLSAVPEPSSILPMALGLVGLLGIGIRRRLSGRVKESADA